MTTVFLTGATGNMGSSALRELLRKNDRFHIKVLARPSVTNRKKLAKYSDNPSVEVLWGDLTCYDDIMKGVTGSDYVLHVGGMVSPAADPYPVETMKVNLTAARNIVKAVKAQPEADKIGVVYVGSVAQVGHHTPPHHWGRTGDPQYPSKMDWYAVSKCLAEWEFAESGLKKWVSIRQTGMLYPELLLKGNDPISFHVPFNGVLEWSTIEDSGRCLAACCDDSLPDTFWRSFYNLSSGAPFRLTNYEFEKILLDTLSCPPVEKVFRTNWFATRNFHGEWYTDADKLEEILHFREGITSEEYFRRIKKALPWYFSLAFLAPAFIIRAFMKHIAASQPLGTLYWFKHGNEERIRAHFGSREEWEKIPSWKDGFDTTRPSDTPDTPLDHGYDETRPFDTLTLEDMAQAAAFRGGRCITADHTADKSVKADPFTPLEWECQFGHRFTATPNTVLKGGHWCPECYPKDPEKGEKWNYEKIAEGNPFFAQVYDPK